jgi:hypothetical protein
MPQFCGISRFKNLILIRVFPLVHNDLTQSQVAPAQISGRRRSTALPEKLSGLTPFLPPRRQGARKQRTVRADSRRLLLSGRAERLSCPNIRAAVFADGHKRRPTIKISGADPFPNRQDAKAPRGKEQFEPTHVGCYSNMTAATQHRPTEKLLD